MSFIMELIGPELSELSALELEKFAMLKFVYTLAFANIDQSVPNLAAKELDYGSDWTRTSRVICP